jgi:hypothetical protein
MMSYAEIVEVAKNACKEFRNVKDEACDVGHAVHDMIELFLKNKEIPENYDPEIQTAFAAFLEWYRDNNVLTIATEIEVIGDGYGGRCDWVGLLNGKVYALDWKTSKGIYKESFYQIAAYRNALDIFIDQKTHCETGCKRGNLNIDGAGILNIHKLTGIPEFKDTSKTYEHDLKVFYTMRDLYFLTHPRIAKKAGWEI